MDVASTEKVNAFGNGHMSKF